MFKKKEQQGLQIRSARSSWGKNTEHYSFSGSQKCSLKHSSKSQSYKTRDVSDCKVPLENTGGKKIRFNYEVFLPAKQQTGLCIHSSVKSCCIFWLDHSSHVNSRGMCLSQFLTAPNAFHFLVNLRNLPSSLPYSLQNNLVGFCFLLTTYLNLFTLIPTATLIEQLTPCVPHDHIFSLLYSLAPHTPSTLCYLPPPPSPCLPTSPFLHTPVPDSISSNVVYEKAFHFPKPSVFKMLCRVHHVSSIWATR